MSDTSITKPEPAPLDYRKEVVLALTTPIPEQGLTLTPQQAHYLDHLTQASVAMSELVDLLKRSIYYGQAHQLDRVLTQPKVATIFSTLTRAQEALPAAGDWKFTRNQIHLLHAAIGLTTESGELLKSVRQHIYGMEPLDRVNFREELGDCYWYFELGCYCIGTTRWEVCTFNARKLFKRYPGKFSADSAVRRDLVVEREALT